MPGSGHQQGPISHPSSHHQDPETIRKYDVQVYREAPCPSVPMSQCPSVLVSVSLRPIVQCRSSPLGNPQCLMQLSSWEEVVAVALARHSCPPVPVSQCPSAQVSQCPSAQVSQCPGVPVSQCPSSVPVSQCQCTSVPVSPLCPGVSPGVPVSMCPRGPLCPGVPVSQCPCVPVYLCPSVPVS
jgi:hypothetical protein